MTEADRASYRRQFEQAEKRLPRRHVINHVTWRDGQLSVMSAPAERAPREETDDRPRVRRGVQVDLFD